MDDASQGRDPTDRRVAEQYEAYPYPPRDPAREAQALIVGSPSHLAEVDHWVFGAARPASRPLNALIAGGGTGDAAIMLAQHMADAGRAGTVTYLDRSAASRRIAEARAQARGLGNLVWRSDSLLDLPRLGIGPFDYIDCCGVLHHLPDPAEGLAALTSVLAPGGGIGLMVYAPHGRTGIYPMQDALRLLAPTSLTPQERVATAKRVLKALPETNWFGRNPLITDHLVGGDAGLYDLLLHERDRAYRVHDLAALMDAAGLEPAAWIEPRRYDPAIYLADPKLKTQAAGLPPTDRAALAEALAGNFRTHVVYCVRKGARPAPPDPRRPEAVPVLRSLEGGVIADSIRPDGTLVMRFDAFPLIVPLPRLARAILKQIDGRRTLAEIRAAVVAGGAKGDAFDKDWPVLFAALNGLNRLLLKPPA